MIIIGIFDINFRIKILNINNVSVPICGKEPLYLLLDYNQKNYIKL